MSTSTNQKLLAFFKSKSAYNTLTVRQARARFGIKNPSAHVAELRAEGHVLIHDTRVEPWGQTIARILGPEGLLVGLCITPWLH